MASYIERQCESSHFYDYNLHLEHVYYGIFFPYIQTFFYKYSTSPHLQIFK